MLRFLFLFPVIFLLNKNSVDAQNNFSITGKMKEGSSGFIYLRYSAEDNKSIKDSSQIENDGSFSFKGKVDGPTFAFLEFRKKGNDEKNSVTFFIEPSAMTAVLEFNNFNAAKFTGSNTQNEYAGLNKKKELVRRQMEPLEKQFTEANNAYREAIKNKAGEDTLNLLKEKAEAIREKFEPYNDKLDKIDYTFFDSHPQSYVTLYTMRYHIADLTLDILDKYYTKFGSKLQQSKYAKNIKEEIEKLRGGSPGSVAKDFLKADINGDTLSLSSYKGQKYVLLDFWASWCIPCRKGNPHLKEVYAKYKDKGFEIVGISDDDDHPDKWKKAVEQDQLPWRHVLRGIDWIKIRKGEKNENDISEIFGIHSLPTKILIDKNGVIRGRFNEEEDGKLDEKLKEIFAGSNVQTKKAF